MQPSLPDGFVYQHDGKDLLVFDVPAGDAAVMVVGNGYPLRIGDRIVKAEEPKIRALKARGLAEGWVNRPSTLNVGDLEPKLLREAKQGAGYPDLSDEDYLLTRKLADRKGSTIVLRRAAELLFGVDQEHPNMGIRIFRVLGTERRVGAHYNVEERPRIEGPLPKVLEEAFSTVSGLLRKPSRLRGTRFKEMPEYPDFAWREAVLNAVAHRDYDNEGRCIEVSLFDDHMEVTSPGGLLPEIRVDELRARARVHQSRNPRIVRSLVDFGFMRDQGEGIPRLFAEMEGFFLPEPELETTGSLFRVTLRNTPTFSEADSEFIASLGSEELSDVEFRALLEAFRNGVVDNARLRPIAGLDTLGASRILRGLRDRGLLVHRGAAAGSYYELSERFRRSTPRLGGDSQPSEAPTNRGDLPADGGELDSAKRDRAADGGELDLNGGELDSEQMRLIATLGRKPRKEKLRTVLLTLLAGRWWTTRELAELLRRDAASLVEDHLGPMTRDGQLRRLHAETNHPEQAYRVAQRSFFENEPKDD